MSSWNKRSHSKDKNKKNSKDSNKATPVIPPYPMNEKLPMAYINLQVKVLCSSAVYPLGSVPLYQAGHKYESRNLANQIVTETSVMKEVMLNMAVDYYKGTRADDALHLAHLESVLGNMSIECVSGNIEGYSNDNADYDLDSDAIYQAIVNPNFFGGDEKLTKQDKKKIVKKAKKYISKLNKSRFINNFDPEMSNRGFINLDLVSTTSGKRYTMANHALFTSVKKPDKEQFMGATYLSGLAKRAIRLSNERQDLVPWDRFNKQFIISIAGLSLAPEYT